MKVTGVSGVTSPKGQRGVLTVAGRIILKVLGEARQSTTSLIKRSR
jgi:hypothetical protein